MSNLSVKFDFGRKADYSFPWENHNYNVVKVDSRSNKVIKTIKEYIYSRFSEINDAQKQAEKYIKFRNIFNLNKNYKYIVEHKVIESGSVVFDKEMIAKNI